jgi:RNA polymerase sigma factor (sigma-70 family)
MAMTRTSADVLLQYVQHLAVDRATATAADNELLQRFAERHDEAAFTALVRRHGAMVYHVCRRTLGNTHDAEDACQATFLALAARAGSGRWRESLAGWLHEAAHRIALKARTTTSRRQRREGKAKARTAGTPLDEITARELQQALDDELSRLPEKYRAPLVLCYLEGATRDEAAQRLGWPASTLKLRIERGRELLRQRFLKRGVSLSVALGAVALTAGPVPAALLQATARTALSAGISPPHVLALVRAGLHALPLPRLKIAAAVILAASLVGGVGLAVGERQQERPIPTTDIAKREAAKPRLDAYGDPLPDGAIRRLGTLRFRQGGGQINRLLLSRDGKTLVSKCFYGDPTIRVWEFPAGKLAHSFPGHYAENRAVAITPDGKTLAVGRGAMIYFYDLNSGQETRQLKCPPGETEGLAFSADGKLLASGHDGQTVLLWDVASGKELAKLPAKHNRSSLLAFSPDGKTLASGDTLDKVIRLFDVESRKERQQLTRPSVVHDLAFSPDGSMLAAGGNDGTIPLWEVTSGKLLRELHGPFTYASAVAWAPDGKMLASSEYDNKGEVEYVRFWDPATGKEQRHIAGKMGLIRSLVFTANGQTLIGGGAGIVHLWDVARGEERPPAKGNDASVWALAVSPDGKTLAYSGMDIHLWDMANGRDAGTLPGHHWSFMFSPDGKTLAGGSSSNVINLWNVANRQLQQTLGADLQKRMNLNWVAFRHLAFAPDGKLLASCGDGYRTGARDRDLFVHLWDPVTGKELRRFDWSKDNPEALTTVEAVAFAPDGRTLAASGRFEPRVPAPRQREIRAGRVRLWDVATGKQIADIADAINGSLGELEGSQFPQSDIVMPCVVFSPDGHLLAMNSGMKFIPVWEAITGRERCRVKGHDGATACVAFAPDTRTLASAGYDHTIRLWDMETGKELRKLTGHRGKANALAFTPDGKTLISGGDDTTILFWDVARITQRERAEVRLAPQEWEKLWADLAGTDAAVAHQAMARLTASPGTAAALKERLHPAPKLDANRLDQLLRDLDSEQFAVREKATRELEKLGDVARSEIEGALARADASPELRRRLERLQKQLAVPTGDRLRELRALEVLERMGMPESGQILKRLSNGAADAQLTQQARAAMERLVKRSAEK